MAPPIDLYKNGSGVSNPHPTPIEPGKAGRPVELQSNIFGIVINQEQKIYRYDVSIFATSRPVEDFSDPTVVPIEIAKKTANDHYSSERKAMAGKVFEMLFDQYADELASPVVVFYDRQSILFSVERLKYTGAMFRCLIKLTPAQAVGPLEGLHLIEVQIKPTAENYEMPLNVYKEMDNSLVAMDKDRTIFQFLQIGLVQHALANPQSFLVFEKGKVYMKNAQVFGVDPMETKKLPDGKELKVGAKYSVQLVEGPKGRDRANISVAIDAKKAAFHKPIPMPEKAVNILTGFNFQRSCNSVQIERLNIVLRGLMVTTTHGRSKKAYKIIKVAFDSSHVITLPDKKISVRDYYQEKYNLCLQAPLAPLICVQAKKETFFPMEVCTVLPDQRVGFAQQTAEQMKETTKECAVPPIRRQTLIMNNAEANEIFETKHGGFRVVTNPMKVNARQLAPPVIRYNNGHTANIDMERFTWKIERGAQYLIPGKCDVWAFLLIVRQPQDIKHYKPLAERLYNEAIRRGVQLEAPVACEVVNFERLEEMFQTMAQNKVDFALMVTDDSLTIQDEIKSFERKYQIVTQNIKLRTAREVLEKGKPATVENLCNKMNVKLGGINYSIKINGNTLLQKGETLVIGLGATIAPPGVRLEGEQPMPTVVGYAANISADVDGFCGDFELVDPKLASDQLIGGLVVQRVIDDWMKMCGVGNAARKRPTSLPKRVVLYRGGVPETAYDKMIQNEIPAIQEVLSKYSTDSKNKIALTYIIVTKDHCTRLFRAEINPSDRANKQNIDPGCVVDTILTSPKFKQFYLNSHIALQGSALTPLYTILCDDCKWSMDDIEEFTYSLCYMHQIVALPTSLPTPLYVANRYAERGRRMVVQHLKNEAAAGVNPATLNFLDEDVKNKIVYKSTRFSNLRVNA
ncbi:unnamed protein product, partial [Mesorhabditis belari]|uniref:Uncharacterized protein n=1 Tax=Mesorhabditis belari TaxID=2138241 RepID=A0AAF3FHX6_9BILA